MGIKDIDAFCGFIDDVGANKGVLISDSGFTEGAIKRAAAADIKLTTMTLREAEDTDWKAIVDEEWEEEHRRSIRAKRDFAAEISVGRRRRSMVLPAIAIRAGNSIFGASDATPFTHTIFQRGKSISFIMYAVWDEAGAASAA